MADTPSTTTQTMVATLGATVAKNLLMIVGSSLAAHGIIGGSNTETFVSIGMVLVGGAWSFWNSYGRAIVLAKLEVWKATAQAQAEALDRAKVLGPTTAEIADKIPDPAVTASSVAKVITAGCLALLVATALFATPALAQRDDAMPRSRPSTAPGLKLSIDPLGLNKGDGPALTGNLERDMQAIWSKIITASNADLTYASAMANSAGTAASKIRQQCWDAILVVNKQASGSELKNPDGTPMERPSPDLFTKLESLAEVIDNLSPQGTLYTSCAGAAQLAKRNVLEFISAAVTGAAALGAGAL